jgi:hypothetical protein
MHVQGSDEVDMEDVQDVEELGYYEVIVKDVSIPSPLTPTMKILEGPPAYTQPWQWEVAIGALGWTTWEQVTEELNSALEKAFESKASFKVFWVSPAALNGSGTNYKTEYQYDTEHMFQFNPGTGSARRLRRIRQYRSGNGAAILCSYHQTTTPTL